MKKIIVGAIVILVVGSALGLGVRFRKSIFPGGEAMPPNNASSTKTRKPPEQNENNIPAITAAGNPFLLHADYNYYEATNSLGAGKRHFLRAANSASGISDQFKEIDGLVVKYDQPMLMTLRSGYGTVGGHGYCMFEKKELDEWTKLVEKVVERYDGDNDFGCVINNDKDCYKPNDGLSPSDNLRNHIAKKPITYWQVENEWLWQINHCPTGQEPTPYTESELVEHLKLISNVIRENGKDAKVVLGALTGVEGLALIDGFIPSGYIEMGYTDCGYKKVYPNSATPKEIQGAEKFKAKTEYVLIKGAPYYDAIDFHHYENDPYNIEHKADWINSVLEKNGIKKKELVSLENAGPYFFFALMGEPKPGPKECKEAGADPARSYSDSLLSSAVVKNHVVSIAAGLTKIAWSTLAPTLSWSDNFVRTALVNENKEKKPAFYTYKLMTDKLSGFSKMKKIDEQTYRFNFPDGRAVYVVWSNSGTRKVNLGPGSVKVTHIVTEKGGATPRVETSAGSAISVSSEPVFIDADKATAAKMLQ